MSDAPSDADPALDDAYRDFFRDEPAPPQHDVESVPGSTPQAVVEEAVEVETGRLFRSRTADGSEAILAVRPEQVRRLRTLGDDEPEAPPAELIVEDRVDERIVPVIPAPATRADRTQRTGAPGLRPGAVYVIDIVVTVIAALIDVYLLGDGIGWLTGVGLLIATAFTAWVVRRSEWVTAAIAPPLAFLVAALTAGQLNLATSGGSFVDRIAQVFFTLGNNWLWILGSVALATGISAVRHRLRP
jgi:hypothetical protein